MRALIIANGTLPPAEIIRDAAREAALIVCADGGANEAMRLGLEIDAIIGDFDSLRPETEEHFASVPMIRFEDQESTDLEKAIVHCLAHGCTDIDVVGASAGRIDHVTGALGCFRRFANVRLRMLDGDGILERIDGDISFESQIGAVLSLIPLTRCEGVTTRNLRYALDDEPLELGVRDGTSNEVIGEDVGISVRQGTLLLYRLHAVLS